MSITAEGICNLALAHLKISKQIANLATDQSAEASACNLFYSNTYNEVLRAWKWPFASNIIMLSEIEANPFPDINGESEWAYAYQYPADCANLVRILSGIRDDTRQSRIPYRVVKYNNGKMILTDMENAQAEYTSNAVVPDSFDADFIMAFSYKLAVYLAPRLTGADPFKLGDGCLKNYFISLDQAKANALNEEQPEMDPDSEFVRARSGGVFNNNRGGSFGI